MGATSQGTSKYPVAFGRTGWKVSPIGFGAYRVGGGLGESPEEIGRQEQALENALRGGVNLIDTSTNYTDGASETLIGNVLDRLAGMRGPTDPGPLSRESLIVVSKAGYVQGKNLDHALKRESEGRAFPEMNKLSARLWHCMHPEFLEDQISRSLERLKLEQLDVLLLHNPEYFLKTSSDHREYYRRIKAAFIHLEKEVERGRIQKYGVSSNSFVQPKESQDFTSLETLVEIASEIGAKHFAVIQFPFNLLEPGAAFEANNTGKSVTELAVKHGLATMINRPLNAFSGERLIRLADFPHAHGSDPGQGLVATMKVAMELETRYPGKAIVPANRMAWAHIIRHNFKDLSDIDSWRSTVRWEIRPALIQGLRTLLESGIPACQEWATAYTPLAEKVLEQFTEFLEEDAAVRARRVAAALDQGCPPLRSTPPLSQKVLRLYRAIPGLDCILLGMRKPEYASDALAAMKVMGVPSERLSPEAAVDGIELAYERIAEEQAELRELQEQADQSEAEALAAKTAAMTTKEPESVSPPEKAQATAQPAGRPGIEGFESDDGNGNETTH